MKANVLRRMSLLLTLIISLALVACAPAAKKKPAAAPEPEIISKPGFYKNNKIGFSFRWHKEAFPVKRDLNPGEVISFAADTQIPNVSLYVVPKDDKTPPLTEAGETFKEILKGMFPSSKRFKLRESKMVSLASGMQANYS